MVIENNSNDNAPAVMENTPTAETSDILEVLRYDPFAAKSEDEIPPAGDDSSAGGNADDASAGGDENGNAATGTEGSTPPVQPATKPAAPANTVPAEGFAQIAEHLAAIASRQNAPAQEESEPEDQAPAYDFTIPDQLVELLTTTDNAQTFKNGLAAFAKGIALSVHQQMKAQLDAIYAPRFEQLPQLITVAMQAQARHKEVETDFYGTYPELNNKHLRPIVKQVGEQVAKQLGKTAWDAELRDETAKQVKVILGMANAKVAAQPQTPKTGARMLNNQGARPTTQTVDEQQRDIVDTLFSPH